jgi:hypothetical protein
MSQLLDPGATQARPDANGRRWTRRRSAVETAGWPLVVVSASLPSDLDAVADALEAALSREEPFAVTVLAPNGISEWQRLLWLSPEARRRLRRIRAALGTWCAGVAHVVGPEAPEGVTAAAFWQAELTWGCATVATRRRADATAWLSARLAAS